MIDSVFLIFLILGVFFGGGVCVCVCVLVQLSGDRHQRWVQDFQLRHLSVLLQAM